MKKGLLNGYAKKSVEDRREAIKAWVLSFGLTSETIANATNYVSRRTVEGWRSGKHAPDPLLIPLLKEVEPQLRALKKAAA